MSNIVDDIKFHRAGIKRAAAQVWDLHRHPFFQVTSPAELGDASPDEMHANIVLAFRHLEDASMRLGKVIQAYDGGKSVYDDGPGTR